MTRSLIKILCLTVVVSAGWIGLWQYERRNSDGAKLEAAQKQLLEQTAKTEQLKSVVQHLQSETRAASLVVLDQQKDADGKVAQTTLLFQEYGKDGKGLPAKRFTFEGQMAHLDAMVIRFKGKYVEDKDPLRGRSIALFTKLFGDNQTPGQGFPIDEPGHIPAIYKGADAQVGAFEQQLWRDFWKLAKDQSYREQMGVDVLQGESVWWKFDTGLLYTVTLQADGGMVLRSEPLKPIYLEMLKREATGTPVQGKAE